MNIHILLNYIDLSRQATANLHIYWPRISLKLVVTCVINWQAGTKLIRHGEERDGFVTPNTAAIKKRYDGFKGISGLPRILPSDYWKDGSFILTTCMATCMVFTFLLSKFMFIYQQTHVYRKCVLLKSVQKLDSASTVTTLFRSTGPIYWYSVGRSVVFF